MVLLFSQTPRLALGPTQDPSVGIRVKKPGYVADHALPTNATVKKSGTVPLVSCMLSWFAQA